MPAPLGMLTGLFALRNPGSAKARVELPGFDLAMLKPRRSQKRETGHRLPPDRLVDRVVSKDAAFLPVAEETEHRWNPESVDDAATPHRRPDSQSSPDTPVPRRSNMAVRPRLNRRLAASP